MFNTLPFLSGCSSSFRQAHLGFRLWRWALFLSVLCPKWQMTKLNVAVTWNPNFFSDATLNEAAQILRLLHIEELRELQTKINEAIVAVQAIIADPKTDHRLGKVGRWERGRGGKLKTDRLNYGSIGHKFFFSFCWIKPTCLNFGEKVNKCDIFRRCLFSWTAWTQTPNSIENLISNSFVASLKTLVEVSDHHEASEHSSEMEENLTLMCLGAENIYKNSRTELGSCASCVLDVL